MPDSEPTDVPVAQRPQIRAMRALFRANAVVEEGHKALKRELGLHTTQFDLIAALGNTEGLRMSDLAHAMITSPSNVTRTVRSMEDAGLVERHRSPDSDREVIARLTPAGEEKFRESFLRVVAYTSNAFDSALTRDEQVQLADLLEKLRTNLTFGEL